jgi:O-antigen/teichoic acid export membrane protein
MPSNSESPLPASGVPETRGSAGFLARLVGHSGNSTIIKQRLGSIAHLLTGNATNAVIMLIGTVVAARTLGPAAYGVFALVLTVCRISERLLRFESWQPLIRFAAQEEITGNPQRRSQLFLYGLLLDVGSAAFAAILAVVGGYVLMPLLKLQPEHLPLIAIYAVAIGINIRGVPTAALRLSGQFRTLAYVQIFSSLVRLSLASIALVFKADLLTFVVIWTVAQMTDSLLFLWLGFRALKSIGIPSPLRAELRGMTSNFPSFMKFAWSTNFSSGLRTLTQEADTLLVGALVGTSAAGFYHIAKRIAKVAQQVGDMVQAVLYPDMARLWARSEKASFRHLVGRIQLALAAVGLALLGACWLVGNWLIQLFFGQEFAAIYPMLIAQLIAVILIMHAAPSRSAMLAMNRPGLILLIAILSTGLFFAVAFVAMPIYGAIGANFAHIAFAGLTALALDFAWWHGSREQLESPTTAA